METSCGAVLFSDEGGERRYVLVVRDEIGDAGFPKGHMEAGESMRETALREIEEETRVKAEFIDGFEESVEYSLRCGVRKRVVYFLARFSGQEPRRGDGEPNGVECLPYAEAMRALTFANARDILKKAEAFIIDVI